MSYRTRRELLIAALTARGYLASQYNPMTDAEQRFTISPTDKRRLADNAWKVILTENSVRIAGRPIMPGVAGSSPMPRAMRQHLYIEGERAIAQNARQVLEQEFGSCL